MRCAGLLFLVSLAAASAGASTGVPAPEERPQFVLFCYDVTPIWGRTIEDNNIHRLLTKVRAARPEGFEGPDPTVTVFINTGYFQMPKGWRPKEGTPAERKGRDYWLPYRAARDRPGTKVLRYGKSIAWIEARAARLKVFQEMGVEIAAHGVMHLNGAEWSEAEHGRDLDEHQRILDMLDLPRPRGYRAPFIATKYDSLPASLKDPLYRALSKRGYRYDSSKYFNHGPRWPRKIRGTEMWIIPIETARIDGENELMFGDYGQEDGRVVYRVSMRAFEERYRGNRAPILFGGHGEHMRTNLRLMKEICYRPGVRCGTFSELVDYMDAHPELSAAR